MFVIKNDAIRSEFDKTSWFTDYERYSHIVDCINTGIKVSKADANWANDFAYAMQTALDLMRAKPDEINAYMFLKGMFKDIGFSPEDFEYGVFGNLVAGPAYTDDEQQSLEMSIEDFDDNRSFGYIPAITKIVSNEPHTIVMFNDNTQVTVTCEKNETFDARTGVLMAVLKKAIGSRNLQHLLTLIHRNVSAVEKKEAEENTPVQPDTDLAPDIKAKVDLNKTPEQLQRVAEKEARKRAKLEEKRASEPHVELDPALFEKTPEQIKKAAEKAEKKRKAKEKKKKESHDINDSDSDYRFPEEHIEGVDK